MQSQTSVREFMHEFRDCHISVDCGPDGYYQGLLRNVKYQEGVEISRPLRDGIPLNVPFISLKASNIRDVKVLKIPAKPSPQVEVTQEPETSKKETSATALPKSSLFSIEATPVSVLREKSATTKQKVPAAGSAAEPLKPVKLSGLSISAGPASSKPKQTGVTGTRISVKQLLDPSAPFFGTVSEPAPASVNEGADVVLKYNKYGDFRHFTELQSPAPPCRLNFGKRNAFSHGPSGIPLLDASNGYSGYKTNNVALNDPIDFNVLNTDFDFDSNLAIFKRSMSEEGLSKSADGALDPIQLVKRNFRNDENVLSDPSRVTSWVAAMVGADIGKKHTSLSASDDGATSAASLSAGQPPCPNSDGAEPLDEMESSEARAREFMHEFRDCHISVDCGPDGYYQGLLRNVKYQEGVEISRPLRDGIPLNVPLISLKASNIRDVKVVKIPPKPMDEEEKVVAKVKTNEVESNPPAAEPVTLAEIGQPSEQKTNVQPTDSGKTATVGPKSGSDYCASTTLFSIEAIPVSVLRGKNAASKPTSTTIIASELPESIKATASVSAGSTVPKSTDPAAIVLKSPVASITSAAATATAAQPKKPVAGTRITVKDLLSMKGQQRDGKAAIL